VKFDVISVKANTSGSNRIQIGGPSPDRFTAVNANLRMLLRNAFRVQDYQIVGGPSWMDTDRFDIEAKAEGQIQRTEPCFGPSCPPAPMQSMIQSLLADRFQLKTHPETRETPVYELNIGKGGFKLKPVAAPERPAPGATPTPPVVAAAGGGLPTPPPGAVMMGRGQVAAGAAPFNNLAGILSQVLGRPVVDKTGITGFYDFRLTWTPDPGQGGPGPLGPGAPGGPEPPPVDPSGPSIFTAIQEQLG